MIWLEKKKNKWKKMGCIAIFLFVVSQMVFIAKAEDGMIYTAKINRCYANPVTGEIEDSGGEAGYATGQGMVESCIDKKGILEVTASKKYYLTVRLEMLDDTSKHQFQVQKVGDKKWTSVTAKKIAEGTDSNGKTRDIRLQVPEENCVVCVTAYVEAMGRNVIFYFYPSDYKEGNQTELKNTMVIPVKEKKSEVLTEQKETEKIKAESDTQTVKSTEEQSVEKATEKRKETSTKESKQKNKSKEETEETTVVDETESEQQSTEKQEDILDSVDGLSVSTSKSINSEEGQKPESTTVKTGNYIFEVAAAVTVSGLILIGAVSGVVYYFRRNWCRWGGGEDDEEE